MKFYADKIQSQNVIPVCVFKKLFKMCIQVPLVERACYKLYPSLKVSWLVVGQLRIM